jgi:hypothetical protein
MSTESAFVVNVKSRIGTIVTVRGDNFVDLSKNINSAVTGEIDKLVGALEETFLGDGANAAYAAQALGGTVVSTSNSFAPVTPPSVSGPAPSCQHGTLVHKAGTGAKGPWQAWMCPLPKERKAEQCQPQWIRKGQPGWVN